MRAALLSCLLLSSLLSSGASAQGIVFVDPTGRVAYQARPEDTTRVLFERGREPGLSPDGKQVAYWVERGEPVERSAPIVLADVATRRTRVWREGNLRAPRFSPDGKQLLFSEMVGGRWAAMVAPVDHPDRARPISGAVREDVFEAVWLPDGDGVLAHDMERVYWLGLDGKIRRQLALDLGSSTERVLPCPSTDCLVYSHAASSSPQLARALAGRTGASGYAVFRLDLKSGASTRLTSSDLFASQPSWPSAGERIYFVVDPVAVKGAQLRRRELWSMRLDGTGLRRVATGEEPGP